MSFIHDALVKAQKEKDAGTPHYQRIFSLPRRRRSVLAGKGMRVIALVAVVSALAFGIYSWLDFGGKKPGPLMAASKPVARRVVSKPVGKRVASKTALVPAARKPQPELKTERIENPKEFCVRARHFHKIGRLRDAKRFYQRALAIDPEFVDALNNLGVLYIQEGNYPEARKNFENAIQHEPEYVDSYYNLACLLAVQGLVKESLSYLKTALSLDESVRKWARRDRDLQNLKGVPEFERIIRTTGASQ
jgi:tetratricopeptide (TPR) repeat protein